MKRETMKTNWLVVATLIFSIFIGNASADTIIVRGDINIDDGPKISFSAPIGLLQALKTSGISAMVENKEELCHLIDSLIGELESIKGNHLLMLKAKNEVEAHVWVEEANRDESMRANFVFVDIAPGKHEPEVSLRLPQGIFLLGSFIGNQFVEEHRKEILDTFRQMCLIKIKEKDHRHGHDPPHHEPEPVEEMHQRIGHLKEKIDHLRREGRHDEAEGLKREAEEIRRKIEEMERGHGHEPPHHGPEPVEEMHQRIGHLKEKIDHLRREGRHDEAEGLKREVEEIRKKIEEMERGHDREQPHHEPSHDSDHRIHILNEAVDNMLKAVQRLHEADMHELAEKLTHEAEEFRREIHK